MKLFVVGAGGPTGRMIVSQAVARGHSPSALLRAPTQRPEGAVEVVIGDVLKPETYAEALKGQDAVLCALGTKLSRRPTTLLSDGTRALTLAMRGAGVRRLIAITGIGAGDSRGHGGWMYDRLILPILLAEIYRDKDRQESIIRESGADWTIVRPAQLTDSPASRSYRTVTTMDGFTGRRISRADVADFMLTEAETGRFVNRTVAISD